jgi:hypothetical protein
MNKELNNKSNLRKVHLGEYEDFGIYLTQISDAAKPVQDIQ